MREKIKGQLKTRMGRMSEIAMYALSHVTSQGKLEINLFFDFCFHCDRFDFSQCGKRWFGSNWVQDCRCDCDFLVFLGVHVRQHLLLYPNVVHVNHLPATGN